MKRIGTSNDIILITCQGKRVKSELKTAPTNVNSVVVLANTNTYLCYCTSVNHKHNIKILYLESQQSFHCKPTTMVNTGHLCTILSLKPADKVQSESPKTSCFASVANQHSTFTYTQLQFTKQTCGCFESLCCFCFKLNSSGITTCQFRYPSDGQLHFMQKQ